MQPNTSPQRLDATLDDKYTRDEGIVFMTGIQALVRMVLDQRRRDRAAGATPAATSPATRARRWPPTTARCARCPGC